MLARIPYEACPLCDGRETDEVITASCTGYPLYKPELPPTMRWVRCRACEHVFVDGYFSDEALAVLLSEVHRGQAPGQDIEAARYVAAKIVEGVEALRASRRKVGARARAFGGRWLDVGFGNGSLLTTAAELGWDVVGLDLREDNVRRMKAAGFEARAIELTQYSSDAPFDVISMADVLEHMPFPRLALARAHELLADGGMLFLSMPNSDGFLWETLTKSGTNPYFAELEHLHNFGRKRLFRLLEEQGFSPLRCAVSVRYRACIEVVAEKTRRPRPLVLPAGEIKLNLGCGRSPMAGWVNVDSADLPGVDLVTDLEEARLPFDDDSVAEIHASHVIEHVQGTLGLMQELHRVARPGAVATFRVPYGSSDEADEDPTHVRRYFWNSWGYFSQPYYWRADYGYRGDWEVDEVVLTVSRELAGKSWAEAFAVVQEKRNVVKEMVARLRAVKPIREPLRGLQRQTMVRLVTES